MHLCTYTQTYTFVANYIRNTCDGESKNVSKRRENRTRQKGCISKERSSGELITFKGPTHTAANSRRHWLFWQAKRRERERERERENERTREQMIL